MDPYTLKQKVLKLIFQLESAPLNEYEKNVARIEFFKQAYIGLQKSMEAAGDLGSVKQEKAIQEKEQNKITETKLQRNKQWPYQRQQQLRYQKKYKEQKQDEQPKEGSNSSYSRDELMELSSCSLVNFEDDIFASSQEKEHNNDENENNKNEVVETQSDD